ncbi:MAG: thiamine pyrophosphate-dependent enzyme [bacterium]|nr:thiamine pyrophosphate-dependent enzyme [bacterium]
MRSEQFGVIPKISQSFTREESLEIFKKICLCRSFERNAAKAYNEKLVPGFPVYLSLGQEAISAGLSMVFHESVKRFVQHRCHDIYICWGGDIRALRDELLGLPSGCAKGMGGSASIHCPSINMFGHDGHVGSQVPIAVGYALGTNQITLAIMGDAGVEEGYVLGAMGEAVTKKAPVLFVCYDNNLSLLTEIKVRRSWSIVDVARAHGMPAVDITNDPWLVAHHARVLSEQLPAFLNIRTCRELWHAGSGCDGPPEWNRYELVKKEMAVLGLEKEAEIIEKEMESDIDLIWNERRN